MEIKSHEKVMEIKSQFCLRHKLVMSVIVNIFDILLKLKLFSLIAEIYYFKVMHYNYV